SLAITSTVPVAASLRTVVNGDLGQLAAVPPLEGSSSAVVAPSGEHRLVVSAAERAGVARLHFIGAEDKKSADQRTRLRPGVTTSVEVPPGARAVVVDADVPYVGSLRSVGDNGITSLPLRQLETERLIPDVRPSWP
ncbi:MAG: hypothetical protein L0H93_20200, partial [Nocardioides sp.]|nr:hypothetical protein [Nocardioides sp.]